MSISEEELALPYLRGWRLHATKTQRELAEAAGVGLKTISRAEAGERVKTLTAVRLARALGVTLHQLVSEEPTL